MPQDIISLVIDKKTISFMKATMVDIMFILSFGVSFSRINGLQCSTMIFIDVLKYDESLF